ncbi:MAG: GNAT family N-acetyltransferase [Solirubrobacteraceae bacterium]
MSSTPSERPPVAVRRATPADHAAIVALVESAYRGMASRAGWTTEADLIDGRRTDLAMVDALAADPAGTLIVIDGDDGLLATCHVLRRPTDAYVGMVAVAPGAQGSGIGGALLGAAEEHVAVILGRDTVELAVIAQRTELIAWYRRRGYLETGERRPFPYGDERYGVPRRPDLAFVVLRKALG